MFVCYFRKGEAKYLELDHTLNEVQFAKSACRKQLNKAMNFAKDLVAEQETLLKALNQRQQENKAVKKIGCDIATRMDTLRNQLKVLLLIGGCFVSIFFLGCSEGRLAGVVYC